MVPYNWCIVTVTQIKYIQNNYEEPVTNFRNLFCHISLFQIFFKLVHNYIMGLKFVWNMTLKLVYNIYRMSKLFLWNYITFLVLPCLNYRWQTKPSTGFLCMHYPAIYDDLNSANEILLRKLSMWREVSRLF